MDGGWPPSIKDASNVHCIEPHPANVLFTLEDTREYLQIAIRHAEVKNLLQGRWETLGCHLVSHLTYQEIKIFESVFACLIIQPTD